MIPNRIQANYPGIDASYNKNLNSISLKSKASLNLSDEFVGSYIDAELGVKINNDIKIIFKSSFYQTAPIGDIEQDWFINSVIRVDTKLNPKELLLTLLNIESEMGRIRKEKWGPRLIDLDLLFYDNLILNQEDILAVIG